MPYQLVEEYCGKWWHYFWAGPVAYIHQVDLGEDVSPEYREVAQPANLLGLRKHSIPVACIPPCVQGGRGGVGLQRQVLHASRQPSQGA